MIYIVGIIGVLAAIGLIFGSIKNNPILILLCVRILILDAVLFSIWFAWFIATSDLPFWFKYFLLK